MATINNPVNLDNCDAQLLETKDRLWDMLSQARDEDGRWDKIAYCEQAEKVLFVLDTTQGMFAELRYAYKAMEICERISDVCWEFLGHCCHAMTIKRVERVRNQALVLVSRFHRLQQEAMAS